MKPLFVALIALAFLVSARAEQVPATPAEAQTIRVAVAGGTPFITSQDGIWTGLSMDIWEKVTEITGWKYTITSYPDALTALEAVSMNAADVVVSDIPITSEGLKFVEFSQPYFRSGLQIMISDARPHTMARLWEDLSTWEHLQVFWILVVVVILSTVAVTLFERKHNPDFPKTWHDGLAEAFYYVITLTLTGKSTYKGFPGVLGRLMLVAWTIFGVITVIYLTSAVTSAMTAEKLQSQIVGPQSLPGKLVGVVKETKALEYLSHHNIETNIYPTLEDAVKALLKGDVRAVVDAAPVLQYFDANHPELAITEVGPVFAPYNYGFALQTGSPLRQPLNSALLQLQEKGILLEVGRTYFGTVYQP